MPRKRRRWQSAQEAVFPVAPRTRLGEKAAPTEPHPMLFDIVKAAILGIVEGLTEYLPVSSTGHLLLIEHFFGFDDEDFGKTFAILIQFGAILALLSIYFVRLWQLAVGFFTNATARYFVI